MIVTNNITMSPASIKNHSAKKSCAALNAYDSQHTQRAISAFQSYPHGVYINSFILQSNIMIVFETRTQWVFHNQHPFKNKGKMSKLYSTLEVKSTKRVEMDEIKELHINL